MIKEPRVGRVKTRVGREIGMVPVAWWYRHQLDKLIRKVGRDTRWHTVLAVSPAKAFDPSFVRFGRLPRWSQGTGNLGERLVRIFRSADPGPILIIGSDIPGIQASHIAHGFRVLGRSDVVFGPSFDGGYWSIGLKRLRKVPIRLLSGVKWSSANALKDSCNSIRTTCPDARISFLDELDDVDTAADLDRIGSYR